MKSKTLFVVVLVMSAVGCTSVQPIDVVPMTADEVATDFLENLTLAKNPYRIWESKRYEFSRRKSVLMGYALYEISLGCQL